MVAVRSQPVCLDVRVSGQTVVVMLAPVATLQVAETWSTTVSWQVVLMIEVLVPVTSHPVTLLVMVLGQAVVTVELPAVMTVQYSEIWLAVTVSHALLVTVVVVAGFRVQPERVSLAVEVHVSDDLQLVSYGVRCTKGMAEG